MRYCKIYSRVEYTRQKWYDFVEYSRQGKWSMKNKLKYFQAIGVVLSLGFLSSCGGINDDKNTIINDLNTLNKATNYTVSLEPNGEIEIHGISSFIERNGNIMHTYNSMYDESLGKLRPASEIYMNYAKDEDKVYYYYLNLYSGDTNWNRQVYSLSEYPSFAETFEGDSTFVQFFNHFIDDLNNDRYTYSERTYHFTNLNYGEGDYSGTYTNLTLKKGVNEFKMGYAATVDGVEYSYFVLFNELGTTSVTIPPKVIGE